MPQGPGLLPSPSFRPGAGEDEIRHDLNSINSHLTAYKPWRMEFMPGAAVLASGATVTTAGIVPIVSLPAAGGQPFCTWVFVAPTHWSGGNLRPTVYYSNSTGTTLAFRVYVQYKDLDPGLIITGVTGGPAENIPEVGGNLLGVNEYATTLPVREGGGLTAVRIVRADNEAGDTSTDVLRVHMLTLDLERP